MQSGTVKIIYISTGTWCVLGWPPLVYNVVKHLNNINDDDSEKGIGNFRKICDEPKLNINGDKKLFRGDTER